MESSEATIYFRMSIYFDITSSDKAYGFLLDVLGLKSDDLIMEYLVECGRDTDLFLERNGHRLAALDLKDVRFVGFHVTASLDDCCEIKESGLKDLQYVLGHNTVLSRLLNQDGITFDIENRVMCVNGRSFDIDYEQYRGRRLLTPEEEYLDDIAHRVYYDFCIDGFWQMMILKDMGLTFTKDRNSYPN